MDQFLFQDLPEEKRVAQLDALSEGAEEKEYAVFLSQDELAARKSQFTSLAIQEAKLLDKKADALAEIKAELAPIQAEKKEVLGEIKSGTIRETGICYKMVDQENKQVGFYNKKGQLIEQRPMTFDDRQFRLKPAANDM
jgi:hypothetical protein